MATMVGGHLTGHNSLPPPPPPRLSSQTSKTLSGTVLGATVPRCLASERLVFHSQGSMGKEKREAEGGATVYALLLIIRVRGEVEGSKMLGIGKCRPSPPPPPPDFIDSCLSFLVGLKFYWLESKRRENQRYPFFFHQTCPLYCLQEWQ